MPLLEEKSIISFKNVTLQYGERVILDAISFEITLGQFVYLVGRTGVGKSTLLRLIYADQVPASGFIRVGETHLDQLQQKGVPHLRRKMGIVFQDIQLLPDRTVYQNIYYALRATGWRDSAKIKQRISEVLMRVGISGKSDAMPHQLSGGEQQSVAIARALINDPIVLVADEPTGNLDPEAADHVMQILRKINLSGTAVLMATHEYSIIKKYPSRVLQLAEGKIIEHVKAETFLEKHWE